MAGITFEQVATAADNIVASGEVPTTRNIRDKLGSGSMATVLKFFRKWKDEHATPIQPTDNTLDSSIVKAISNQISTKVQESTSEATAKLAELQNETNGLIVENESQAELLEAQCLELSELRDQHASLLGRFFQLQSDATGTKTELIAERKGHEAARMELAIAQQRLQALPRLESELETIRAELLEARAQGVAHHEAAAIASAKLEAEITHRQLIAEQAARELRAAQDLASKATIESRKVRDEVNQLRGQLEAIKEKRVFVPKKPAKKAAYV